LDVWTTIEGYPKLWGMRLGTKANLIYFKNHNQNHTLIEKPKLKSDPTYIIKKPKSKWN
jgi:hypothetical protein